MVSEIIVVWVQRTIYCISLAPSYTAIAFLFYSSCLASQTEIKHVYFTTKKMWKRQIVSQKYYVGAPIFLLSRLLIMPTAHFSGLNQISHFNQIFGGNSKAILSTMNYWTTSNVKCQLRVIAANCYLVFEHMLCKCKNGLWIRTLLGLAIIF